MLRRSWNRFWFTGFSLESLAMLRICFGIGLVFFHVTQFFEFFRLDAAGAHFYFMEPAWYLEPLGFERQVPVLANTGFVLLELATLGMILGYRTRLSIALVILMIFYLQGVRDSVTGDVHHRYLVPVQMLFFLLLSKCGLCRSVDSRRNPSVAAAGRAVAEWEASWPIKAMQVYCASFYFWSVLAKLRVTGWVWFTDPRRIQDLLLSRSLIWGATDAGEPVFNALPYWLMQQETLCRVIAFSTFVMEAGFPLILFLPSARARLLFLLGVAFFHVANTVLAYVGFGLFPIVFLVFFDLEGVRRRVAPHFRRVTSESLLMTPARMPAASIAISLSCALPGIIAFPFPGDQPGRVALKRPSAQEPALASTSSLSRFLRGGCTALRDDLVVPLPRAQPAGVFLAAEGAPLLHAARSRSVRRRAAAGLSRALLRALRRRAPGRG